MISFSFRIFSLSQFSSANFFFFSASLQLGTHFFDKIMCRKLNITTPHCTASVVINPVDRQLCFRITSTYFTTFRMTSNHFTTFSMTSNHFTTEQKTTKKVQILLSLKKTRFTNVTVAAFKYHCKSHLIKKKHHALQRN